MNSPSGTSCLASSTRREKVRLSQEPIDGIVSLLREHTIVVKPRRHFNLGLKDRDDEWVVASAVSGGADALVTGDTESLSIKKPPLRRVNPRGLWEMLRVGGGAR
jgi:predicted nucleic acid-binding protein